jgi:hypothetical protein
MTHTQNRTGLSESRPDEEIVVLCMAHGPEKAQKMNCMKKAADTILKYKPNNVLGRPMGLDDEQIASMVPMTGIITAVFNNKADVENLVKEIKSQKLGISFVVSALHNDVRDICKCAGLKEHTYNISLGVFGKTEKLPDEKSLEITTQCGHALISAHLVEALVKKIRKGKTTIEEAAHMLAKPCVCGIGNTKRIEKILGDMI